MLYRTGFELTTLVVIATDCTVSCKSNYHTITTTTAPVSVCVKINVKIKQAKAHTQRRKSINKQTRKYKTKVTDYD